MRDAFSTCDSCTHWQLDKQPHHQNFEKCISCVSLFKGKQFPVCVDGEMITRVLLLLVLPLRWQLLLDSADAHLWRNSCRSGNRAAHDQHHIYSDPSNSSQKFHNLGNTGKDWWEPNDPHRVDTRMFGNKIRWQRSDVELNHSLHLLAQFVLPGTLQA